MPIRIGDGPPPGVQGPDALDAVAWLDRMICVQAGYSPAIPRLRPLLRATDDAALAGLVRLWPEALGAQIDQVLDTLDGTAEQGGNVELASQISTTRARLAAERSADPVGTALAHFLETETGEAALELVGSIPALREWTAVERLAASAANIRTRGDERAAQRYGRYQRQLARWLYLDPGVQAPVPPPSDWPSCVERYVFGRQTDALVEAIDAATASAQPDVVALVQAVREQDAQTVQRLAGELESRFWCERRAAEALATGYLEAAFRMH